MQPKNMKIYKTAIQLIQCLSVLLLSSHGGLARTVSYSTTLVGCFMELTNGERQLPLLRYVTGADFLGVVKEAGEDKIVMVNSIADPVGQCSAYCAELRAAYMGLQYYCECYCGNSPGVRANSNSQCSTKCNGDSGVTCGGPNRNSVYKINYNYTNGNNFKRIPKTMNTWTWTGSHQNKVLSKVLQVSTPQICTVHCSMTTNVSIGVSFHRKYKICQCYSGRPATSDYFTESYLRL